MTQKIFRAGKHSLAVIIPADFVHSLGIAAGDKVKVVTEKENGRILLSFSGVEQLTLTPKDTIKH
jgi:antitoxin component of MazEF toxin-antitoxin module